jgi:hypothetical protein
MKTKWLLLLLTVSAVAFASDVQWTRIRGKVKSTNAKTQTLTIEDVAGDLLTLHIDGDIDVYNGKDLISKFADIKLDDKVLLLYDPKAPTPKDSDEPVNGVYKPLK